MAWRSHGTINDDLVSKLKSNWSINYIIVLNLFIIIIGNGVITSDKVEATMRALDRKDFCPQNSYNDAPQRIGMKPSIRPGCI